MLGLSRKQASSRLRFAIPSCAIHYLDIHQWIAGNDLLHIRPVEHECGGTHFNGLGRIEEGRLTQCLSSPRPSIGRQFHSTAPWMRLANHSSLADPCFVVNGIDCNSLSVRSQRPFRLPRRPCNVGDNTDLYRQHRNFRNNVPVLTTKDMESRFRAETLMCAR